jgi:serine/threonine protein kinase
MKDRIPLAKDTLLRNRYRIDGLLGKGGMGSVYKAFDERDKAFVALKETFADDEETLYAFKREAKLLENLSHRAFPQVFDFFSEGEGLYLVMELIEGSDLKELLDGRDEPFTIDEVLNWSTQILDALEHLHAQGVIHRDIKPSNLILTPEGDIRILDFGIAKGATADMTIIQATESSIAAASKAYAPLEQVLRADVHSLELLSVAFAEKTKEIFAQGTDARSDIYALGATLYELLTKSKPVSSSIRALTLWSGQEDKLVPIRQQNENVPPFISDALHKSLAIEREDRFGSSQEMSDALGITTNPVEYASKGIECLEKQDYDCAIENFTRAIRLNPQYSEAHNNRGIAHTAKGDYEKAFEDYNTAITLNPEFFYAFINRGKLYSDKGEYEWAIEDYDRAIRINSESPVAFYNRANAYASLRKFERAIEDYSRAIELNPKYELAYNNRSLAYSEIGEHEKSKNDLIMYLKSNSST